MTYRRSLVLILLLSTGCASGAGDPPGDTAPGELPDTTEAEVLEDPTPPVISDLLLVQNPTSPLSATLELTTDDTVTATLRIEGAGKTRRVSFVEPGTSFTLPVLGLRAETDYVVTLTVRNSSGVETVSEPMEYSTGPFPDGVVFPPREVLTSQPSEMQPGVTVYSTMVLWFPLTFVKGLIMAVDEEGEVIWYHRDAENPIEAFTRTADGSLLYLAGFAGAIRADMMGNVLDQWDPAAEWDLLGFHHDILELPDGNLAAIGVELRDVEQDHGEGAVTDHVMGDTIVEFTPGGELVRVWSTFDLVDNSFVKEDYHDPFWDQFIDVEGGTKDWLHANSLVYDPSDDSFILSLRHVDWVIKVDRQTGERVWALGEGGDFEKLSGAWFYHQHSLQFLEPGRMMLFDNGNRRPGYEWVELWSRALEFTWDEEAMTWTQSWEWAGDEPFFSQMVSDADRLPNGNVLVADGARVKDQAQDLMNPANSKWSRIVEVTDAGEVVFEMEQ
ncbi:MAG: aryl-sulfate sulfotransferase, partial [Deltaproteobacteria bacterium]|nr:aryl-sulfate sulfotransferase [Deltaproteobacteria bacterium]